MPGHVFVVRTDITKLACDAWLVPTDAGLSVSRRWLPGLAPTARKRLAAGRLRGRTLVLEETQPLAVMTDVGGVAGTPLDWYLGGVRAYLRVALESRPASRIPGRSTPLFALPLVGTGRGGKAAVQGDVVRGLVRELHAWTDENDADVVLALWSPQAFAAAQAERRRLLPPTGPGQLAALAQELGDEAALGRLVLFLGSGIGRPAGLPDWEGLLERLAADAGMSGEMEALEELAFLDRAGIIEARLAALDLDIRDCIARHVQAPRFALAHALLASLPVTEAVTTNYDTLFERALEGAGKSVAILPYEPAARDTWLLKLHGSIGRGYDDIVLTRTDYIRYAGQRAALAGIVQALLITRRMLFVGFSLVDDNFHRIVDDVRRALGNARPAGGELATALLLYPEPLKEELWKGEVRFAVVAAADAERGRELEMFLDRVLAAATTNAEYLLDDRFSGMLDPDEQSLGEALRRFTRELPAEARKAPAWRVVQALLERLGGGV